MTIIPLSQVFGQNATQTATTLTITKTDLAAVGLTASANNTADSLLAAIVAFAEQTLTTTNQNNNPDQTVTITDSFDSISIINNVSYRTKSKTIAFSKVDTNTTFNPNDY